MAPPPARFDVLGIGNAIVDVLAHGDDALIERLGLHKGTMTLIDAEQAEAIYAGMGPAVEVSGGSCANTIAGLAALGATTAFVGKVRDDQLGRIFAHDIRSIGVDYGTAPGDGGVATARCLIVVTPDAERTMGTFLGASIELSSDDLDEEMVTASRVTYLEGYLWDAPKAKAAFRRAMAAAHAAGRKVALTLSDPFVVDRHRDELRAAVERDVDILFANEDEIRSLYEVESFDEAAERVRASCEIAALTRSGAGSVIVSGDQTHRVAADIVTEVVDTTGAGDLYAAGFLFGYTRGLGLEVCGRLGSIAAAEAIGHMGPRPEADLAALVAPALA